jgi:hypothetical protein
MRLIYLVILLSIFFLFPLQPAFSQDEEKYDNFRENLKKEYFTVEALIQFVSDFQNERTFPGNNGFSIGNARIRLLGELDNGIGYFFQTNFIDSPALLDAKMYWSFSNKFTFHFGLFKAPFSREFLTYADYIDFVNRSQAVNALAPKRQVGVQVSGWLKNNLLMYQTGVFNGNGLKGNNNDNQQFLYVARLSFFPKQILNLNKTTELEIGINGAGGRDTNLNVANGLLPNFTGDRRLFGADFRFSKEKLLLSGEYIYSEFRLINSTIFKPWGYQATIGYLVAQKSQILFRWDSFTCDGLSEDSDLMIFGYNYFATSFSGFALNYIINTSKSDVKNHQILINVQISL